MRWILIGLVVLGTGCTSIMDRLTTDQYSKYYIAEIDVVDRDPKGLPAPEMQNTLLSSHTERVQSHQNGGWQVVGVAEFNTSSSTRENHLYNLARRKGASLVVYSKKFDRREQEIIKRREYQEGERISVNGTTVQLEGRWVDVVDVETRVYHDYRATFLRPDSE
ncbi:MAG: hypothetical protein ACJZ65_02255 [Limisphaerales bacterium]